MCWHVCLRQMGATGPQDRFNLVTKPDCRRPPFWFNVCGTLSFPCVLARNCRESGEGYIYYVQEPNTYPPLPGSYQDHLRVISIASGV